MMIDIECPCGASFEVDEDEVEAEIECRECGQRITVMDPEPEEDTEEERVAWQLEGRDDDSSLMHEIGAALRYPLEGSGPYVLLSGWLLGSILYWAFAHAYFLGFVGTFFLLSYFLAFLEGITLEAAGGGKRPPEWPDPGEYTREISGPVLRFTVVAFAAGLPYIGTAAVIRLADGVWRSPVVDLALNGMAVLWIFLLPIAYLTGVLLGPWHAFNYAHLARSIARTAASYVLCFLVVLFLVVISTVLQLVFEEIPFVGWLISSLPALYLWIALARLLGVYYYTSRWRLDWLRSK